MELYIERTEQKRPLKRVEVLICQEHVLIMTAVTKAYQKTMPSLHLAWQNRAMVASERSLLERSTS